MERINFRSIWANYGFSIVKLLIDLLVGRIESVLALMKIFNTHKHVLAMDILHSHHLQKCKKVVQILVHGIHHTPLASIWKVLMSFMQVISSPSPHTWLCLHTFPNKWQTLCQQNKTWPLKSWKWIINAPLQPPFWGRFPTY
jgi:hypothetical protein